MSIAGELERLLADELYPYRFPLALALLTIALCGVVLAYRLGWHRAIRRHRLALTVVGIPLVVLALPLAYYTLSPLWQRTYIEEASPLAASAPLPEPVATLQNDASGVAVPGETAAVPGAAMTAFEFAPAEPPPFAPRVTHNGTFRGADDFHFGRGNAILVEVEPGRHVLRLEDFSVRNGPDLFVYLSPRADGFAEGALNLGRLKATDGAFNYDVPEGVDVSQYESAIVWCRRFAVLFAVAPLNRT